MVTPRVLALAACIALLLIPAPTAEGDVTRGLRAPPLDARDGRTLAAHRGRVVLLEFFGTRCPHCRRLAPRMNEIHAGYAPRGVVVWGVTPDGPAELDTYRQEYGVQHATSVVPMDALREYVVPKYPALLLISPTGRVMWRGEPERLTDRVLDAYLAQMKLLPTAPPDQASVARLLADHHYGLVETELDRLRACVAIDRATCRFVLGTLDWIAWHRAQTFAAAERDLDRGRPHAAWATYRELAACYAGTPHGERARGLQDALGREPAHARDIAAEEALAVARRGGRWRSAEEAAVLLEAVARSHADTLAGAEALRLARLLRGEE